MPKHNARIESTPSMLFLTFHLLFVCTGSSVAVIVFDFSFIRSRAKSLLLKCSVSCLTSPVHCCVECFTPYSIFHIRSRRHAVPCWISYNRCCCCCCCCEALASWCFNELISSCIVLILCSRFVTYAQIRSEWANIGFGASPLPCPEWPWLDRLLL
jgi:hypothetical protein